MNLNYRGVVFDFVPPEEEATHIQSVDGIYRGRPFSQITTHEPEDLTSIPFDLSFRGVSYHHAPNAGVNSEISLLNPDTAGITEQFSSLHDQNILDRLQRRIQSARANGDQVLVEQLEAELNQMIAH